MPKLEPPQEPSLVSGQNAAAQKPEAAPSPEEPHRKLDERFIELHHSFIHAIRESCKDCQVQFAKANTDYAGVVQDSLRSRDAYRRAEEAFLSYMKSLQDLRAEFEKRIEESFRTYVSDLQKTWGQAEATKIDPTSLAALSQSMIIAAYYGAGVRPDN